MILRSEQLQALEAYAEHAFEIEMADRLKLYSPKICEGVGNLRLQQIVALEIRRARGYDLTRRGPIWLFLQLSCALGCGFDTDPQLRWAAEVLADPSIETDMLRAEYLEERVIMYFDCVLGPDRQYALQAFRRSLECNFEDASLHGIASLYPEKFEFIGEAVARLLLQQSAHEAVKYRLPPGEGAATLTWMKFAWGHRICEDPYYPEISSVLNGPSLVDGADKLRRVISIVRTYAESALP